MKEDSPYGRGFIAAAIVIGAVLLCGALLVFTGPTKATGTPNPQPTTADSQDTPADQPAATPDPGRPATPAPGNPATPDSGDPATPNPCPPPNSASGGSASGAAASGGPASTALTSSTARANSARAGSASGDLASGVAASGGSTSTAALTSSTARANSASGSADSASTNSALAGSCDPDAGAGCGLPPGDQAIPTVAPSVDGWEVSRRVVVPRSSAYGPGKQDSDGFRRCFAHSPTGAVFAAYSAVAAMADQRKVLTTVGKLMLPGPDTDALLEDLRKEPIDEDANPTQIAGYRVLDASADRATVMLAMPVETAYVSANFTLVWHNGDWRVVPPTPGDSLGSPYAQQRDLSGFVGWSGV